MDGNPVASNPYSQAIQYNLSPDNDLLIGKHNHSACPAGNNFTFIGDIDEVEIFSRALTATEVANIYNAKSDGKCKFKTITIDIKPGSFPNCFNINSKGVIQVALLGSADFNVSTVVVSNLTFNGLTVAVRSSSPSCHIEDINLDGFPDLVCQVTDNSSKWTVGTSIGIVKGVLTNGTAIQGHDSVCIKPASK